MNTAKFLKLVSEKVFNIEGAAALPTQYYIGLSTTNPATTVSEPATSKNYKRVEISGNLTSDGAGHITNKSSIDFPESSGDWGTITHFVIYDAETGGTLLMYDTLSIPRTAETGTIMTIGTGSLSLSVVNP